MRSIRRLRIPFGPLATMLAMAVLLASCSQSSEDRSEGPTAGMFESESSEYGPPTDILNMVADPWIGDFNGMVERRVIRALVIYNASSFFFDEDARPRGISYEALTTLEKEINQKRKEQEKVHVVMIPTRRDRLIPYLRDGYGDLALGNLTITEERSQLVDFSEPTASNVSEIVVSGPKAAAITKIEDLAGRKIWVRESSSYHESLLSLNKTFKEQGLKPVKIQRAEEQLETEDILQLVATGVYEITIADSHIAEAWADALEGLELHPELAVRSGGQIGWMFRQNSPELAAKINAFVGKNKKGTLFGNILIKRYLTNSKWINSATTRDELAKLSGMVDLFKNYGSEYGFDWLMIAAQGYQESGLDQSRISRAGAVGVMQLLRSTAADPNVNIPEIDDLENNIHAGNKYMRFILDHYFGEAEMDELNKHLFAFASYNAGPNRIARLRKKTEEQGLDPNVWFQNVEIVVGREVGREPVRYVSNIFKYYVAYKLSLDQLEQR